MALEARKKRITKSEYLNTKVWRNVAKETVGNFKNMNSLASQLTE